MLRIRILKERIAKKKHLAKILSVPERTINGWVSRIDKDSKDARNKRIFDLWLSCHTQEEIAERENVSQPQVKEILSEKFLETESIKPIANHLVDFDVPIFNVWT